MAKKVTIDIEVNGKMQKATLSAKKLKKALDETKASQDGLNASTRKGYRAMQGSAQATSNSTKAFSKQAGVVGGLVPVYATFAANVFAVSAAFGVLKRAAALERLETSLERIGALSGRNLGALAADLRTVADQAISTEQSLRAVSVGTSAGFSSTQILQLAEVAKGASLALGRDMGDAIDRLIRGTAKLEPEILDELGIIVRLDQAASDFATSIGKLTTELTQFEKVQAFVNATITQGLNKYQQISEAVDPSPYDKLAASFNNLSKEIIVFSNNILGPVIDFFATNKIALTAALTFFAGTLVNQVIPAIDDVIARNAAIATSAAAAARKGRTKVVGEFEKQAKQIKVLDFSPPIAKQLIPQIKAGEASTKDLKRAILSLRKSEAARLAYQKANATTVSAKYKAETAAIIEQRKALEGLATAERGRETFTATGRNAASASRSAKRNAIYGQAIDNAGFIDSLGIAARGVKNQAKEVGRSADVHGKFAAVVRTASTSVSLFGRALLNAIPIIGQILFVIGLVAPAFQKAFESSAVKKSIEESDERFKIFAKTIQLVRETAEDAGSAIELFANQSRASTGIFDELAASYVRLGKAIDEEYIAKLKEAQEAEVRAQRLTGQASRNRGRDTKRAQANQQEALDSIGTVQQDQALELLTSAQLRLAGMGDVLPGVQQGFQTLEADIKSMGESGTINIIDIIQRIKEISTPFENFTGNVKGAIQQFANLNAEITKLGGRQVTPFSNALEQSLELEKSVKAVMSGFLEQNPGTTAAKTNIEDLEEVFPGTIDLAHQLEDALKLDRGTIESASELTNAQEVFNKQLVKNNEILIEKNGVLKNQQAVLSELSRLEKIGAGFTELRLKQEDKVIDAKIDALTAEKTNNELLLEGAEEKERIRGIDAEITALTRSKKTDEERTLAVLEAEGAQKKRLLDVEQKLSDLAAKRAQQEFARQRVEDSRTLREERQSNPFAFLTEDRRSLDLEIDRTEKLLADQEKNIDDRKRIARELAELEFEVLAARLAAEASIARTRAAAVVADNPNDPSVAAAAGKLEGLATKLFDLSGKVAEQATEAGAAAEAEVEQKVDELKERLEGLKEARKNLEDVNVLIDGTARSLESNMTNAFASLIDGTKSAKEAFKDMAKAILADIARMIAKQLVLNMLIASTGGEGGFFANLLGRNGAVFEKDPNMRYGGVAEKVQQFTGGGIAKGRQAGYPAILHGTEAVVPLPNGKEIPVEMRNGSEQQNNVVVNVNIDSGGAVTQETEGQGLDLGTTIANVVQQELLNQKRQGGILNPNGVA